MKDMKEQLSEQAKAFVNKGERTMLEVSIDDAISTLIKIIEIILLEEPQEKSISPVWLRLSEQYLIYILNAK